MLANMAKKHMTNEMHDAGEQCPVSKQMKVFMNFHMCVCSICDTVNFDIFCSVSNFAPAALRSISVSCGQGKNSETGKRTQ